MDEKTSLKLHSLINEELETCDWGKVPDLSAISYYLIVLSQRLIDPAQAKREILSHLRRLEAPSDWIAMVEDE